MNSANQTEKETNVSLSVVNLAAFIEKCQSIARLIFYSPFQTEV